MCKQILFLLIASQNGRAEVADRAVGSLS
jgi:hypothetical protein